MPNSAEATIVTTKRPTYLSPKFLLATAGVFLLAYILGFAIVKFSPFLKPQATTGYPLTKLPNLPFSPELLQNPLFSDWTAKVEGKVLSKEGQIFTLSRIVKEYPPNGAPTIREIYDGNTLKIVFIPEKTTFKPPVANLSELPLNVIVQGDIEIYRTGDTWALIGKRFSRSPL